MPETIQRSFSGGEISPSLQSRADITKYATGLNLCENFLIRSQGGAYTRPGFQFIAAQDDSARVARLIPFSFNTLQTYMLVFEHLKMRVIKDGGLVLAGGGGIFELTTPYTEAQLPFIGFTQSADVMTLAHASHDPANLSRFADNNWTLTDINYASTVAEPVISSLIAVGSGAGTFNKDYTYVVTAIDENGVESLASGSFNISTASLSTTAAVRINWGTVPAASFYRIYKDPSFLTGIYGFIGESSISQFDDFNIAPLTSDSPPSSRQPFTGVGNKPQVVNYYQQRQVFANTANEPQVVFTTQSGDFNSLRTSNPARDDDAVTFTIVGRQVNEIRHIVTLNKMMLLTSGGEWKVGEGADDVMTPSSAGVKQQSYNGSSWVPPVVINSTVLYLQEKGARVRDLGYDFASDSYTGNDLSLMSEHLFDEFTITSMAYSQEPYSILWCVRDDGVLLGLTYQKEHKVWAWHQHKTNGLFESVAVVTEGKRDVVYVTVNRTIQGSTVRYIERLHRRETLIVEDCFYVDSGLTYDGAATTVLTALDHLEGETVAVLADGNHVSGLVVSGGSITLPRAASKVHVGLEYIPALETLDLDTSSVTQSLKSLSMSVSKITIEVDKSRGGWVGPRGDDIQLVTPDLLEIKPRYDSDGYDVQQLKTFKQQISIHPLWGKGGGVRIEQRSPLPLSILSIIPQVDIGGN